MKYFYFMAARGLSILTMTVLSNSNISTSGLSFCERDTFSKHCNISRTCKTHIAERTVTHSALVKEHDLSLLTLISRDDCCTVGAYSA